MAMIPAVRFNRRVFRFAFPSDGLGKGTTMAFKVASVSQVRIGSDRYILLHAAYVGVFNDPIYLIKSFFDHDGGIRGGGVKLGVYLGIFCNISNIFTFNGISQNVESMNC
jgi:hypothetical protein